MTVNRPDVRLVKWFTFTNLNGLNYRFFYGEVQRVVSVNQTSVVICRVRVDAGWLIAKIEISPFELFRSLAGVQTTYVLGLRDLFYYMEVINTVALMRVGGLDGVFIPALRRVRLLVPHDCTLTFMEDNRLVMFLYTMLRVFEIDDTVAGIVCTRRTENSIAIDGV